MPILEVKILPIGTKSASVSDSIAKAVTVLRRAKGIKYQVTPMGTIVEANSVAKLFQVAQKMYKAVLTGRVQRVVMFLELDDRRDKKLTMDGKLQSLAKYISKK